MTENIVYFMFICRFESPKLVKLYHVGKEFKILDKRIKKYLYLCTMQPMAHINRFIVFLLAMFIAVTAWSIPAKSLWISISQSDGSAIEVCSVGDERLHYFITRDSIVVLPTEAGDMVYAKTYGLNQLVSTSLLAHEAAQRSAAERNTAIAMSQAERVRQSRYRHTHTQQSQTRPNFLQTKQGWQTPTPYIGIYRQLVILVEFQDMAFKATNDPSAQWNNILNTSGYNRFGADAQGSLADYFRDQSYGQFQLTFDVYGPVKLDKTYAYYGENNRYGDDKHPGAVVREAIAQTASAIDDWTIYDWDGDGWVEQVLIIYAGQGENYDARQPNLLWPHQWDLESEGLEDEDGRVGNIELQTARGPITISSYCMMSELDESKGYGTFGGLCHEYSHCLGLPDSYNTNGNGNVTGSWDLLSQGCYNANGFCPAGFSAYQRWCCGWLDLTDITHSTTVSQMPPLCQSGIAYRLRNDCPTDSVDEYFLIENRQAEGWDSYLPGTGLLITHVDFSQWHWADNSVNNQSSHLRYSIVAANDSPQPSGWAYPYKSNDSLTSYSQPRASVFNPNHQGNLLLGKNVYDLQIDPTGMGSFRVIVDQEYPEAAIGSPLFPAQPAEIYTLSGQLLWHTEAFQPHQLPDRKPYIVRFRNGTTIKFKR